MIYPRKICKALSGSVPTAPVLAIVLLGLMFGASAAQAQEGVTITGCDGGAFGDGCSLAELANNNGTITIEFPELTPPLRVVIDEFELDTRALGNEATDFDKIKVTVPDPAAAGGVPLQFEDRGPDEWKATGGEDPTFGVAHGKEDEIEFRVRVFNLETGEPEDFLNYAFLTAGFGDGVLADPDANPPEPVQAEILERVTEIGGDKLTTSDFRAFRRLAPGKETRSIAGTRFYDQDDERTRVSKVRVRKNIVLAPGKDPGNEVELEAFGQLFFFRNRRGGCAPKILEQQDGSERQLEFCALPAETFLPLNSPLLAQKGGTTQFVTTGPNGAGPFTQHRIASAGSGAGLYEVFDLLPAIDFKGSLVSLADFDNGSLLFSRLTFGPNPGDLLTDAEIFIADPGADAFESIARLGDPVTLRGADYTIDGLFGGQVTASGRAFLNVDLLPAGGATFPTGAVLVFDASRIFDGGGAPLVDAWFPGDTLQTAGGPVRLDNLVEVLDADDQTDNLLVRSVRFAFGSPTTIYVAKGGSKGEVRRIAGSGDPLPGTGDEIFLFQSGKVNRFGDVGLGILTAAAGTLGFSGSAALLSRETASNQFLLKKGDLLPDGSGFTVAGVSQVMVGDGRKLAVLVNFLDAQNRSAFTLIPYDYDDSGPVTPGSPLISSGDVIRDAGGPGSQVSALLVEPRGLGDGLTAVLALMDDNTQAVLRIPLGAEAVIVPGVTGRPRAAAEAEIVAAGLTVGTVTVESSAAVPAGNVISQNPAAGSQVPAGSPVDLVVSSGSAPLAGDLDGDSDVDRDDLNIILGARNTPASGPADPRDLDGDGQITVLDARRLVLLCTRPSCATQ